MKQKSKKKKIGPQHVHINNNYFILQHIYDKLQLSEYYKLTIINILVYSNHVQVTNEDISRHLVVSF